ncbi:hypothetical protein LVJ94_46015 [Pendulispora rubella]|uniref:Outer membrane protein beta-barrel domain-containing protein n=1 Tax=Pendulispora rubella TaxID=2741070 RepID=A0ABZ2L076_9BACT
MPKLRTIGSVSAAALLAVFGAGESSAMADDTIKHPGDHPDYKVEIEPHGTLAFASLYGNGYDGGSTGFGAGGRFTIPIVQNGFIPNINNNVGITFGLDFVHYSCDYRIAGFKYDCSANFLFLPVAMQWNFFVAERWSVAAEPGLFIYHGFYDDYCNGIAGCDGPTKTSVQPAFYAVGRYHFNEKTSLTMRIGYPTFSVGVSFFL